METGRENKNGSKIACGSRKIIVVGIGPGHPDYMVPAARAAIENAEVLVGGRRALSQFAREGQRQMPITGDMVRVLSFIREELSSSDVVAMVSGDPGYFSLLDTLRREMPEVRVEVIPGISAMQLAFARLALPWHGARLVSFHGRVPRDEDLAYSPGALLGMLTDGEHDSRVIPSLLMDRHGWPGGARLAICARLSYEDERIVQTTLDGARELEPVGHGILIAEG